MQRLCVVTDTPSKAAAIRRQMDGAGQYRVNCSLAASGTTPPIRRRARRDAGEQIVDRLWSSFFR
jgi:hypothetical protein